MVSSEANSKARKVGDVIKLSVIVVLITLVVILIALNIRQPVNVNVILTPIETNAAVVIVTSFLVGVLFALLIVLIRKAKKR